MNSRKAWARKIKKDKKEAEAKENTERMKKERRRTKWKTKKEETNNKGWNDETRKRGKLPSRLEKKSNTATNKNNKTKRAYLA